MKIEILSIDLMDIKKLGPIKARADIMVDSICIKDVRVIEQQDGKPAKVRMPSWRQMEGNKDERWEWQPYIVLPLETKRALDEIILKEYEIRKAKLGGD